MKVTEDRSFSETHLKPSKYLEVSCVFCFKGTARRAFIAYFVTTQAEASGTKGRPTKAL
ncbi:MAG: hypothetical protein JXB47_05665 [Anaerolineae bacterium]|nr:hypothetical protein [Anaerolineae bacterium]